MLEPLPLEEQEGMRTSRHDSEDTAEAERIAFFEEVLSTWALAPNVTIACGQWDGGSIMELVPRGAARLLPATYSGRFAGIRELRLLEGDHHVHIDLGRVHSVEYRIEPSVCLGFRPSFEVCFMSMGPGGARTGQVALSVLLAQPYRATGIREDQVESWFARYVQHVQRCPDLVRLVGHHAAVAAENLSSLLGLVGRVVGCKLETWDDAIWRLTRHERPPTAPALPYCKSLAEDALALPDASLVIFRDRTLIEFKTQELGGLFESREGQYASWQFGRFESHHCHLALHAVTGVEFSAEPVPCQGGRLNYTVWFLVSGGCGNPFRPDGYFSVVLNRPYQGDAPRWSVIQAVFDLYERHRHHPWVKADEGFRRVLQARLHAKRSEGIDAMAQS